MRGHNQGWPDCVQTQRVKIVNRLINILLADDDVNFCRVVRDWVDKEPGLCVVGEAHNGRQAVAMAMEMKPDIVLMDVAMPDLNGIDATREIVDSQVGIRVIGISSHIEKQLQLAMLRAGACSYIVKENVARDLLPAIRSVSDE